MQLNQHAIVMATQPPYDTVQLTATPLSAAGAPMTDVGPVTFSSRDSSVTVSPTGLLTAHYVTPGIPVPVFVALRDTVHNITHQDSALVVVTAQPAVGLKTYSLQPAPGDSAKRALHAGFPSGQHSIVTPWLEDPIPWPVTAVDSTNATLCGPSGCSIPVYYQSSNPLVATITQRTGMLTKQDTGQTVLSAQTLYYGRAYSDTVTFRVGLTTALAVGLRSPALLVPFPLGQKIVLGVGGIIAFENLGFYGPVQITFSDPTMADSATLTSQVLFFPGFPPTGSGNVTFNCDSVSSNFFVNCFPTGNILKARRFPRAGTVQMHISVFPTQTYEIDVLRD